MKHIALFSLLPFLWLARTVLGEPTQDGAILPPAPAYQSAYLAVGFEKTSPGFSWFDTDSLGGGRLKDNVILNAKLPGGDCTLESDGPAKFHYTQARANGRNATVWSMEASTRKLVLHSEYIEGAVVPPFVLLIDQRQCHATLLAHLAPEPMRASLPGILHLPDHGTFRVSSNVKTALLDYDARRRQPENFVRIAFPAATREQRSVEYTFDSTLIYPELPGLAANPIYDGYRRNFLNLVQLHPRLRTLANNSSSDVCGFCLWQYSELAMRAPVLAPGLTVLDLVRESVDRVLDGGLTYGQVGYHSTPIYPNAAPWKSPYDSLDLLPSVVIAGCQYIQGSGDVAWAGRRFERLLALGRKMLAADHDGNGLIEYPLTGNSGSWTDPKARPANWWDTIGFGHEDAYSNALAFRACTVLSECAAKLDRRIEAAEFAAAAAKLKAAYYRTFFNPETGVLAGWKSADGRLHDYYFTFISGMAISFGLVDGPQANAVLDHLLAKLDQVGYRRFDLGLPGNLVPVRKEDYLATGKRFGGPTLPDGSDTFQIYENGAATSCHAYWLVKALYKLGRVDDARRIFRPMLQSYADGGFQGFGSNGMSKDWRTWQGECNGYEGYLTDGYLALLAAEDDLKAGAAR